MSKDVELSLFIFVRCILFLVFLGFSFHAKAMNFRNVLCMLITLYAGCRLFFPDPVIQLRVLDMLYELTQNWHAVFSFLPFDLNFLLPVIPIFALLRVLFRVRGFGRDFWFPLGAITAVYPLTIGIYVIVAILSSSEFHG